MVSRESIEDQLRAISFSLNGWGRTEVGELPSIILPEEVIYECVNGIYEGGFALLVATDVRVLLVDKKPLNYLTVEDLRFDMINELDYSHRIIGAHISIATGAKNLRFTSLNQRRLRKLINHVQHCMAESKKQQSSSQVDQKQHLERINQQLQTYLLAQHRQQRELGEQLKMANVSKAAQGVAPDSNGTPMDINDYLFNQGYNSQHNEAIDKADEMLNKEIYSEGAREIFGEPTSQLLNDNNQDDNLRYAKDEGQFIINPLKVAYSKLPQNIRSKSLPKPSNIDMPLPNNGNQLPVTD